MITEPQTAEEMVISAVKTARFSFWISLGIGTLLLLLYLFKLTDCVSLIVFGFAYVICAAFINAIILINLLITINLYRVYSRKLYLKGALILVNIPIACLYFLIVEKNMY